MRLIDAPIGIFRFDGELVLKTEYYSENKQSGKYIPDCYIVRTGEYFWGGAKTANELNNLDVEPVDFAELLSTVTDTIGRQAAIEAAMRDVSCIRTHEFNAGATRAANRIKQLPPAEPKRIRGKWIYCEDSTADCVDGYRCDQCGFFVPWDYTHKSIDYIKDYIFCPHCGMKNEVTE